MGYTHEEAQRFISHIAPMICREGSKRGYAVFSTTVAQAIIEGAAGTSTLAKIHHNHFGMKAGKGYKGEYVRMRTKEEYVKGVLTEIYDNFRKYPNDEEGVKGYYDFISSKRYANLKNAKDYRQFAEYIKADGWATASKYRDNLIDKVEKYNLTKYDNIKIEYYPKYSGNTESIVVALESLEIDSSYVFRTKIYNANFSDNYKGSGKQNTDMLLRLKGGTLIKP